MKRIVPDTNVVTATMRSPRGASAAVLLTVDEGVVMLLASLPMAMEYETVCLRPEHRQAVGMSRDEAAVVSRKDSSQ